MVNIEIPEATPLVVVRKGVIAWSWDSKPDGHVDADVLRRIAAIGRDPERGLGERDANVVVRAIDSVDREGDQAANVLGIVVGDGRLPVQHSAAAATDRDTGRICD